MKRPDPGVSADGKVYAGAVLRDPQTGREYDVLRVWRAEDVTFDVPLGSYHGSTSEKCAMHGGSKRWQR